jgi:uncharacterized sodium:solute symporter family permease YidK
MFVLFILAISSLFVCPFSTNDVGFFFWVKEIGGMVAIPIMIVPPKVFHFVYVQKMTTSRTSLTKIPF